MPEQEDKRIGKQVRKYEKLEDRFEKTRSKIIETFKNRIKSEKDFLEVIEKQREYWKDRLKETDPQKDKDRYNELKEKIKSEETLIKQIKEELVKIDEKIKQEHREAEKERKE